MFKDKLFWKFFTLYIALLCLCLSATGFFVCSVIKKHYLHQIMKTLESHATLTGHWLKAPVLKNDPGEIRFACNVLDQQLNAGITLVNSTGDIICQSNRTASISPDTAKTIIKNLPLNGNNKMYADNRLTVMHITAPIKIQGKTEFLVILSVPFASYKANMTDAMKSTIACILLAFAITSAIGFVLIRINTSPLLNITHIAQNFARGNFTQKAAVVSSDEMGDLANAINAMGTELQSKMQTILDDKNKLDAIMAHMNDAIITTNLEERFILVNTAAKTIFGIPKVDLNNDYLWEKIRNEKLHNLVREIIKTQETRISEIEIHTPEKKLLQAHLSPIHIDKNTRGILLVFHDITELRKLENTRREFVANVSHELRTPLASIKGYVETLLERNITDQNTTQEFLGIIMKHTERLDNLIKDILELSRFDSNDLKIEFHPLDIQPCIENMLSHYKEHGASKKQTFELNMPPIIPTMETNEYLLRQLLTNLLDNAVKYTPKDGRIVLKVEPHNSFIHFEISDTGIGIPQEHIPRIFERFYRVDPARSREMGGTGLGLSIVKHIVNLHHGSIKVESTVGVGSTFIIKMPVQQPKYTS